MACLKRMDKEVCVYSFVLICTLSVHGAKKLTTGTSGSNSGSTTMGQNITKLSYLLP